MARETDNPIAAVLRILRGNTPQGVFASRLGIKQAVYSHYENKRREPSLDEVCRIARALGTTPNVLLGFEAPPNLRDSAPPRETKMRTGDNSHVVSGDVNGSGNIVGSNINYTPPPINITINITVNINGQEEEGEDMSEEKPLNESRNTVPSGKVALANSRNTVPSPQKKTPREPPKK